MTTEAIAVTVTGVAVPAAVAPRPYFMAAVDTSSQRKTPPCTSPLAKVDLDEHVNLVTSAVRSCGRCSISQNKLHNLLLQASVLMTSLRNHRRARLSDQISSDIKLTRSPLPVSCRPTIKQDTPYHLIIDETSNYDISHTNHTTFSPNESYAAPPPSYEDAFSDIPPDYNDTNASAVADYKHVIPPLGASPPPYEHCAASAHQFVPSALTRTPLLNPFLPGQKIDIFALTAEESYRTRGKKKKAKQGNQADWFDNNDGNGNDDDNGTNTGGGNGEGQNDGGGDASGGGGNGGDGGKGGGGDDDDDGFTAAGNKKNKKKNKKNKKNEADEEEDGNKETLGDETQQDPAAVADSMWSDPLKTAEADPVDEWATFEPVGGSKKKNGKKNAKKTTNAFNAISDIPAGGGGDGTKNESNFDEVNLDDNVPHINLNFGANDSNNNTFDIGALGSDWASKPADAWGGTKTGGSAWDFGALNGDNGLDNKDDPLMDPTSNNTIWQTGGTKKSSKNKNPFSNDINNTFDFGFGNVTNSQQVDAEYNDNQDPLDEDPGFTIAGSKGKKKGKKGGITTTSADPSTLFEKDDEETASQSAWTTTSDTKKKKKDKKKSGSASASLFGEEATPPVPPPPPPIAPNGAEDMLGANTDDSLWPSSGTGKKGKKNKKGKEDPFKAEDPAALADTTHPDTAAPDNTFMGDDGWAGGWGTAVTKENKKKNKDKQGSLAADLLNDSVDDKGSANAFSSTFDPIGGAFGTIGGSKTKSSKLDDGKKKKSDGWASSLQAENFWGDATDDILATDEATNRDGGNVDDIDGDLMDMIDNNDDGKKKSKKKNILAEDTQTNAAPDGMSASNDFGSWATGSKKEKKNKKTKSVVSNSEPPPAAPNVDDSKYDWGSADFFDNFDSTKNKINGDEKEKDKEKDKKKAKDAGKSKKSKKDTEADVKVVQPDAVDESGKDEFSSLLGFGKNGKKKDSERNNPIEIVDDGDGAFTVQPDAIETKSAIDDDFGFTGFTSTKKGKKGKKSKESMPPLPAAPMAPGGTDTFEPELPPKDEQPNQEPDDLWGFTTSKKDKKKKNSKVMEDADTVKKSSKNLKDEKGGDLFNEEPKDQVAIEDPLEKPKKSSIWDIKDEEANTVKSSAPKTKKEKEKEKEKEKKEKKGKKEKEREELEKAKKEAEEAEEALKAEKNLEGDPNEIVDIVDESTPKDKKKKKGKKETVEIIEDTKPKDTKKKEQKELEGDPNEIVDFGAEDMAKDSKNKKKKKKDEKISGKSSKKTEDDKINSKNDEESFAVGNEDTAGEADDAGAKDSKKESPKPKKEEVKQSDGWSFWGLKSGAKKDKDKDASPKKELGAVTKNDDLATADGAKASDPAPPHESPAPSSPPTSKSAKSKGSAKGALADRIKAFQGDKAASASPETSSKTAAVDIPAADAADPLIDILETSSKPTSAATVSKKAVGSSKTKSSKKKGGKDAAAVGGTADPAQEEPSLDIPDASTPVPGGFPDDAMDNQDNAGGSPARDKEKDKKKDKKSDKKTDKPTKKDVKSSRPAKAEKPAEKSPNVVAEVSDNDIEQKPKKTSSKELKKSKESKELKSRKEVVPVDDDAKMLPTPPPEPKPVKKERARVVRDQNSWGFWGAAPKTESKRKVVKDETPGGEEQTPVPRISRSKSARKASDKDPDKSPQSSGSETKPAKVESKPKASRGMSLSNMFGAPPPPSRSKSYRHSTATPKSRSRRPSMDDYGKLPTPPPDGKDELRVSAKAAKVMGIGAKTSSRKRQSAKGKSRAVPDPYAIDDDDDIVMVDAADTGIQDSAVPPTEPEPSTKPLSSKSKAKGASRGDKLMSSSTEDAVLVDPVGPSFGNNVDEMDMPSPQRSPKRSSTKRMPTSTKDVAGGFMSLFGGFRKKERERRLSDEDEDSSDRRKRTSGGQGSGTGDDEVRRSKGDRRDRRRSHKISDADGNITDGARRSTDAEDIDTRRAQRRARRAEREAAGDMTENDNRTARRKDKERDRDRAAYEAKKARAAEIREKRARQEEENEARRTEERRARRAARDTEAREADARDAERRARRRERLKERETVTAVDGAGGATGTEERPRSKPSDRDRRRSYNDKTRPTTDGDQARLLRHEERRLKRSSTAAGVPEKLTRRRTAPIEDYFDPRNSRNNRRKTSDNSSGEKVGRPYLPTGKDKTSSWVNSVNASPPLPPPVEGTVLDPPPNRGAPANHDDEDAARRERRARRRAEREKERRRDEKVRQRRSSDGSGGAPPDRLSRRKTYHAPPPMDKRGSWLQKIRGF